MREAKYAVNEIFHSIQGEGYWQGTPMTFIRLSGCNLACEFCDTQHQDAMLLTVPEILNEVKHKHVCITGGEPFLHDLEPLIQELSSDQFAGTQVHIETNGTLRIPWDFPWITWSPKGLDWDESAFDADEIKFLCGIELPKWREILNTIKPLTNYNSKLYLMPIMGLNQDQNIKLAYNTVMEDPYLTLTVQLHKFINVR